MAELDPTRPYWPSSPWSGSSGVAPNDADHGDRHTWDARAEGYRSIVPRFCSEFGHQSPPNLATLARVLKPEDLAVGSAALEHRQRATGGTAVHIDASLAGHSPPAKDFQEWHRQSQAMQARALVIGIEALAAARPRCMGALIWQLNDCWPGFSWSLIDSDGTPKPAYFAVQEAFGRIAP
jgi:beta-mannosidase